MRHKQHPPTQPQEEDAEVARMVAAIAGGAPLSEVTASAGAAFKAPSTAGPPSVSSSVSELATFSSAAARATP